MPEVTFKPAWRRKDAVLESDSRAFWQRLSLLPDQANVDLRLEELCAGAYEGTEMIAVSTAVIREVDFVKSRLAMFRCAVDPASRRQRLATQITVYTRRLLELWSMEHPEERLMGMGTVVQSPDLNDRENRRAMLRSAQLGLVGFTDNNVPIRIAWFEHATLPHTRPLFGPNR